MFRKPKIMGYWKNSLLGWVECRVKTHVYWMFMRTVVPANEIIYLVNGQFVQQIKD